MYHKLLRAESSKTLPQRQRRRIQDRRQRPTSMAMSIGTDDASQLSLRGLMSQGLNVVIAKRLMTMDARYDRAVVNMEERWQSMFGELEDVMMQQNERIDALAAELKVTKTALKAARGESSTWKRQAQQMCTALQNQFEAAMSEVQQTKADGEKCCSQVEQTLLLLKGEFGSIVDHIGKHDAKMTKAKRDIERRLVDITDMTEEAHATFSEYKDELVKVTATLREWTNQFHATANDHGADPDDNGVDVTKSKHDESIEVWEYQLGSVLDTKECASALSFDSSESLRLELEKKFCATRETLEAVEQNIESPLNRGDRRSAGILKVLASKTVTVKQRNDATTLSPTIASVRSVITDDDDDDDDDTDDDTNDPKQDQPITIEEPDQILVDLDENVTVHASSEETVQIGSKLVLPKKQKLHNHKVTFMTENDDGEDEIDVLVFVGQQNVEITV